MSKDSLQVYTIISDFVNIVSRDGLQVNTIISDFVYIVSYIVSRDLSSGKYYHLGLYLHSV